MKNSKGALIRSTITSPLSVRRANGEAETDRVLERLNQDWKGPETPSAPPRR